MNEILSVIGTRPQYVKLKPVVRAFNHLGLEHNYIDTGQHYDVRLSGLFSRDLNLPEPILNLCIGSATPSKQLSRMIQDLESAFLNFKPKKILVYGDTNSTLAATLVAAKLKIKVHHIESGLRSKDLNMPEEQNRKVVDHLSNRLYAPTKNALNNLISENLGENSIFVGDVMFDVIMSRLKVLTKTPNRTEYLVCTVHRAENTDNRHKLEKIFRELEDIKYEIKLFAHPRLKKALQDFNIKVSKNIVMLEPVSHDEMLREISQCRSLITDSGGLQKEAFMLRIPCITLRNETEWPETLEGGYNVLFNGESRVYELLEREIFEVSSNPFGNGNAALLVVQDVLSSS